MERGTEKLLDANRNKDIDLMREELSVFFDYNLHSVGEKIQGGIPSPPEQIRACLEV